METKMNMAYSFERMDDNVFEKVRNEIQAICQEVRLTKMHESDRAPIFVKRVKDYFKSININETQYWQEVGARSGNPYIADVDSLFPKKKIVQQVK